MAKELTAKAWEVPGYLRVIIYIFLFLGVLTGGGLLGNMLGMNLFVLTCLLAALSIALTYLLRTQLDRESWISLGWQWKGYEKHCLAGALLALAILGLGTSILAFTGIIEWNEVRWNGTQFFLSVGLMLMVAIYEELAFRGYIMGNLLKSVHPMTALLLSGLLFAIFHGSNPNTNLLSLVNVFLAGILLGINFMFTRNLWFAVAMHFCWNFVQGPVLGYEVSGLTLPSVLTQIQQGSPLLTGGHFGFEGSIINTFLTILSILLLYLAYKNRTTKKVAN